MGSNQLIIATLRHGIIHRASNVSGLREVIEKKRFLWKSSKWGLTSPPLILASYGTSGPHFIHGGHMGSYGGHMGVIWGSYGGHMGVM